MTDPNATPPTYLPAPTGERSSVLHAGRQIRHGPLMPWMCAYAEWLNLECIEPPKISSRLANARRLARLPVTSPLLRTLEAREDFGAYCDELRKGPLEAARQKFLSHFTTYVERHREALDLATAAGDYTAMSRIAEPVLDRVMPKKSEGMQATQVNITLSPNQLAGVSVTYEAPNMIVDEVVVEAVAE